MRKENANFCTAFVSEEGSKLINHDYFAFIELDNLACYVVADSLDEDAERKSAELVTKCILREFSEHPSISQRGIKRYLKKAQKELLNDKEGIRLRVSVAVIVTDYAKFRYASVGNTRAMLIRNDRILYHSKDQSLSQNLAEEERILKDKVAIHEERNNLYSYLGQLDKKPEYQVSTKRKLSDGDVLVLCTRGVWEKFTDREFLSCVKDTSSPQDLVDNVEDFILGKQEEEIDNYTIAVVFTDKTYLNPRKKISTKQILMMAIPLAILFLVLVITLFVRYRNRVEKQENMLKSMENASQYIELNNFEKAKEEYQNARKLADVLNSKDEEEHIGNILLLLEQIIISDQAMVAGDYEKAQELFWQAKEQSSDLKGMAGDYLDRQLKKLTDYLELLEFLEAGERKEEYGDYAGAIEEYKKAKELAADLYDKETRKEALEKQQAAEEALESLRQSELDDLEKKVQQAILDEQVAGELEEQAKQNSQKNALELETKGDELMESGNYLSAMTYFATAMEMYADLGLMNRFDTVELKIASCKELYGQSQTLAKQEADQKSAEEALEEAKKAEEEAKKALEELKQKQLENALEEARKAEEEAKKAQEEARKAAEEAKNSVSDNRTTGDNSSANTSNSTP